MLIQESPGELRRHGVRTRPDRCGSGRGSHPGGRLLADVSSAQVEGLPDMTSACLLHALALRLSSDPLRCQARAGPGERRVESAVTITKILGVLV